MTTAIKKPEANISFISLVKDNFKKSSWCFPAAGIAFGAIAGITGRLFDQACSSSYAGFPACFSEKNKQACRSAFSGSPVLQGINGFKQWEIKTFALATPLIPIAVQIGIDAAKDKSGKGIAARVAASAKKNFTLEQGVYLGVIAASALFGTSSCRALGACTEDFDPSGHFMMKTALATYVSKTVAAIAKKENRTWSHLFSALYAATDAVLIYNTTRYCHTVAESVAGLAWGLGITATAETISRKLAARQSAKKTV